MYGNITEEEAAGIAMAEYITEYKEINKVSVLPSRKIAKEILKIMNSDLKPTNRVLSKVTSYAMKHLKS